MELHLSGHRRREYTMKTDTDRSKSRDRTKISGKASPQELARFCHETAIILKSGIPLVEGLDMLQKEGGYRSLKGAVVLLGEQVARGGSLASALKDSGVFPPYLASMAEMGEVSGNLDSVMAYMALHYEKMDQYGRKVRAAVTYPLVLAILMAGVILLLLVQVLPMFNDILASMTGEIPAPARILTGIGRTASAILPYAAGIALFVMILGIILIRTETGRRIWDGWKLKLPLLRNIYPRILASRIGLGMSVMLKSGLSMEQAMERISGVTGNRYAAEVLEKARDDVTGGSGLTEAFAKTGLFPALFIRMMSMGGKSGELEGMLAKAAYIYEQEADSLIQRLTSSIEPLLVIILSAVVGMILLSVMLPLISIMASIG